MLVLNCLATSLRRSHCEFRAAKVDSNSDAEIARASQVIEAEQQLKNVVFDGDGDPRFHTASVTEIYDEGTYAMPEITCKRDKWAHNVFSAFLPGITASYGLVLVCFYCSHFLQLCKRICN